MGVILEFKPREAARRPDRDTAFAGDHMAEIIIFPGVRIERLSDEAFEERQKMKQGL